MTTSTPARQTHKSDFWPALALFTAFRWLTLLLMRPGGFIRDWSDFDTYLGVASLSDYGLYPFLDFWLEYPPPMPWLMVGVYKLSLWLPVWQDPRLWFTLLLGSVFVLFEVGNFGLVALISRQLHADWWVRNRVLWFYALLFPPVYAMLGFFDGVTLFFLLAALYLILRNRIYASAVLAGLGFAVKVTPVIIAATAAKRLWQRHAPNWPALLASWVGYSLAFAATALLVFAPFLWQAPHWLAGYFRATLQRASWETLWAVLEGYYGFGVVLGNRFNPAETTFAVHPSSLPWGIILAAFGLLFLYFFFKPAQFDRPRPTIAFAGLSVVVFLLASKGYSPQFLVYLLPFVVLLLPNGWGVAYALLLTGLNVLEQPIYFVLIPDAHWLLTVIVSLRFGLLLALGVEFYAQIWPLGGVRWGAKLRGLLPAVSLLALLATIPAGLQAYQQRDLAENRYRDVIDTVRLIDGPETLFVTDPQIYRAIYPHLRGDLAVRLLGGETLYPGVTASATQLTQAGAGRLLLAGAQADAVRAAADTLPGVWVDSPLAGLGTLRDFDTSIQTALNRPALAGSDAGIELLAAEASPVTDTLAVTLVWHAANLPAADYTVFVQALAPDGHLLTSFDGMPLANTRPTTSWQLGELLLDRYVLPLPQDDYRLVVGMYDATGARLTFALPDGSLVDAIAIQ